MKTALLTILAITLTLALLGGVSADITRRASEAFYKEARALEAMILGEDWAALEIKSHELENSWQPVREQLELWIDHRDTDEVTLALRRLRAGLLLKDQALAMDAAAQLMEAAHHLYHRDALRLTNLI